MDKFESILQVYRENIEQDYKKRSAFVSNYINQSNANGVVIGISGGIDSAVTAALCVKALGKDKVLGIWMPVLPNSKHKSDADMLANTIGFQLMTIDLGKANEVLVEEYEKKVELGELTKGNIKARLRMTTLYAIAGHKRYLVSDTCNYSERYIGYMTKGGDGLADFNPIESLTKHQIRLLASYLKIPQAIIDKIPSADLWEGQTDEKDMGFSYYELDKYLLTGEGNSDIIKRIETLHKNSEHKRTIIPGI